MNPEIQKLNERVAKLESVIAMLSNAAQYDADTARAIGIIAADSVLSTSAENPASYDQAVNEAGSGTYNVASVPDGFKVTPDSKLIPYYNII